MGSRLTSQEKRALWILSGVILLSRSAFALLSDRLLLGTPIIDDAYYSLSVARHLALGHGFTYDGIHLTNGIQPLITLIQSLGFLLAGGDRFDGLRYNFVIIGLIEVFFIWIAAFLLCTIRRGGEPNEKWWLSPVVIVAAFQALLYQPFMVHTNGLETSLNVSFILSISTQYYVLRKQRGTAEVIKSSRIAMLGLMCGLMVLSRIDSAVLVAIICLMEVYETKKLGGALVIGSIAMLVSLPWWLFGLIQFGSIMPISGQSESLEHWKLQALLDAGSAIGQMFFFVVPLWKHRLPEIAALVLTALGIGAVVFGSGRCKIGHDVPLKYDLKALAPLSWYALFLFVYYLFLFHAPWFLDRYWHLFEVLWILIASLGLSWLLSNLKVSARRIALAIAGIIVLMNLRSDWNALHPTSPTALSEIGFWANHRPDKTVGVLQSGAAGYLADNVINLDGKVNVEALRARQHDSLGAYIRQLQLNYLADELGTINLLLNDTDRFDYHYRFIDSIRPVRIYGRIDSIASRLRPLGS